MSSENDNKLVNLLDLKEAYDNSKHVQTEVSSPSASGTAVAFIDNISQNTNGVISPTKKTVAGATQSAAGLMSAADKTKLDGIAAGAQVNSLTGVKGNAESTYRTGNVNLTPANIAFIGTNPTGGTLNDTREWWVSKGTCYAYFYNLNQVNGQPSQYGFLISIVNGSEIHQEWWTQPNGAHYYRGGNANTTAMPDWAENVTGVKGNAESTYRTGNVNLTAANVGAVATNAPVIFTNSAIDLTKADNNLTNDVWMQSVEWQDKNNKMLAVIDGVTKSNGQTQLYLGVRNFNTNGNRATNKGISIIADKNNNLTYVFDDAQNARSALGAVAKSGDTMTGSLTLNTGTFTSIAEQPQVNLRNNTYVSGQNPSKALWNVVANSIDKNGQRAGLIHQVFVTNGNSTWEMNLQKHVNGTDYYAGFQISGSMTSVSENKLQYNVDTKALTGGKWQGDAIGTEYGGTGATTPAQAAKNITGLTWDLNTNNTSDSWVPVLNSNTLQHRVIPVAYNSIPLSVDAGGTNATNADAARQNLLTLKTGYYNEINPNTIKHNFIGLVWNITEQPSKIGTCGTLEVMSTAPFADTSNRVRQVFYNYFAEEVWTRKWDGSTWSEWRETYFGASISLMSTNPTISSLYNELEKLTLNYPVNIRINNDAMQSLTGKSISGGYGTVVKTGVESGTLVLSFDICYVAGNYRHAFTTRVSQTTITPGAVYRYTSTTVD